MNSYILKFGEVAAANAQLTALVDRNGKRSTSPVRIVFIPEVKLWNLSFARTVTR